MNIEFAQLIPLLPELFVLSMTVFILLLSLVLKEEWKGLTYILSQATLVGAMIFTYLLYDTPSVQIFDGMFIHDSFSSLSKLFIGLTGFFALLYARTYIRERQIPQDEYCVLSLFSILGMMVVVSAHSLLTLFLGLELFSLPVYAMVALWRTSPTSSEAAMKYFLMGALASGILLYGMSLLYGMTRSLDLTHIASFIADNPPQQNLIFIFGLVFIVSGVMFKLGGAPFHLWVPDVYEGVPTSVTLFISSAPKIAALGMTIRLLVDALPGLDIQWQQLLIAMAILSMAWGNIVAIVQNNLKRMLAYSAIAHMGYLSLGLLATTAEGYAAALFYMITYVIMAMGAFGVLVLLSHAGFEAETFEDLRGLNARNPWLAFMLLVIMFSMAGIPPAVGFFAKMGVLEALINVNLIWLAALALIFAIIGAYYYLRVIKLMYFEEPENYSVIQTSADMRIAVSLNGLLVLGLGIFPSGLIQLCRAAFGV